MQLPKDLQGIIDCVGRHGFAMAGYFWSDRTTMDVGRSIGVVLDVPAEHAYGELPSSAGWALGVAS